jgi:AhpD family alkylhydroperoxidase
MQLHELPLVDRGEVPEALVAQVERLESLGADTTFHRYIAHSPAAADFYWNDFYARFFFGGVLPVRTKEVVRLALASLSGCTFCRQGDVDSAQQRGLTVEQIEGVLAMDSSALPADEQAAFDLAVRLSPFAEGQPLSSHDWVRLRAHFTDEQVAELLIVTSVLAGVGRMLSVAGFIPRNCEVPESGSRP